MTKEKPNSSTPARFRGAPDAHRRPRGHTPRRYRKLRWTKLVVLITDTVQGAEALWASEGLRSGEVCDGLRGIGRSGGRTPTGGLRGRGEGGKERAMVCGEPGIRAGERFWRTLREGGGGAWG